MKIKKKQNEITKEQIKTIIKMRKQGATQKQIAEALNLSLNKTKAILQKLIDDEIIERKRTSFSLKLDNSIFNKKISARKFIKLWNFNNDEQLALHFNVSTKIIKRYSDCIRENLSLLAEKYINYNPLLKLNLPERNIIKLINKEYTKEEIARQLNISLKDLIECVEYMNYIKDERVRKAKRKEAVKYHNLPEKLIIEYYYKYNDYDAASLLGVGHSTFGAWTKQLREEGKLKPKR